MSLGSMPEKAGKPNILKDFFLSLFWLLFILLSTIGKHDVVGSVIFWFGKSITLEDFSIILSCCVFKSVILGKKKLVKIQKQWIQGRKKKWWMVEKSYRR